MSYPDYPPLIDRYRYSQGGAGGLFIIAEAGTGHGGDVDLALAMVDACASQGVSAIKFQHVIAEEILHPRCGDVHLKSGDIDLYKYFKQIEEGIGRGFWQQIIEHCRERKILFLCSFFGKKSFHDLSSLGMEAYKIASPEMNYQLLWECLLPLSYPVFFSSGVSRPEDIDYLMAYLDRRAFPRSRLIHLHCVTEYPAPPEHYNLLSTLNFENKYRVLSGISDHSPDPYLLPALFTALKGLTQQPVVIEKHFTLSRIANNIDDPVAIDERELPLLMTLLDRVYNHFKKIPFPQGPSLRNFQEGEVSVQRAWAEVIHNGFTEIRGEGEEIRRLMTGILDVGRGGMEAILGDGIKRMSPSELFDYPTTKRSLLAIKDIELGAALTDENTAYVRSEKNLSPGLDYTWEARVSELRVRRAIKNGDPIREEDIFPHRNSV